MTDHSDFSITIYNLPMHSQTQPLLKLFFRQAFEWDSNLGRQVLSRPPLPFSTTIYAVSQLPWFNFSNDDWRISKLLLSSGCDVIARGFVRIGSQGSFVSPIELIRLLQEVGGCQNVTTLKTLVMEKIGEQSLKQSAEGFERKNQLYFQGLCIEVECPHCFQI